MTLKRKEAVICSGWGPNTDWIRNIRAHPALQIQIGRESYAPEQRFLSEDESVAVAVEFRRQHPRRVRLVARIFGWGDFSSDTAVRDFVRSQPFVSFRPAHPTPHRAAHEPQGTSQTLASAGTVFW